MKRRDYERLELAALRTKARINKSDLCNQTRTVVEATERAFEIFSEEIARIKLDDPEAV